MTDSVSFSPVSYKPLWKELTEIIVYVHFAFGLQILIIFTMNLGQIILS